MSFRYVLSRPGLCFFFAILTRSVQAVELLCRCSLPGNPDKTLIGCTTEPCKQWLHEECIKHEALLETYKRLGTDKPHRSEPTKVDKTEEEDAGARPLSPTETGAAVSAQQSIDVKQAADAGPNTVHANTNDNVEVKGPEEDASTTPGTQLPQAVAQPEATNGETGSETPLKAAQTKPVSTKKGKSRKKGSEALGVAGKPYQGLFEVSLRMDMSPPTLEFKDLREGVVGGERSWTEPIKCLMCGAPIN